MKRLDFVSCRWWNWIWVQISTKTDLSQYDTVWYFLGFQRFCKAGKWQLVFNFLYWLLFSWMYLCLHFNQWFLTNIQSFLLFWLYSSTRKHSLSCVLIFWFSHVIVSKWSRLFYWDQSWYWNSFNTFLATHQVLCFCADILGELGRTTSLLQSYSF